MFYPKVHKFNPDDLARFIYMINKLKTQTSHGHRAQIKVSFVFEQEESDPIPGLLNSGHLFPFKRYASRHK